MRDDYITHQCRRRRLNDSMSYFQELYAEEEPEAKHDKNKIRIGRIIGGDDFRINIKGGSHSLILGRTGSGKTVLCRRYVDCMHMAGGSVAIIPDAKDEFKSSIEPVQPNFRHLLARGERPTGMPVQAYRPVFMVSKDNHLPKNNMPCSIPLSADFLEENDFLTLLGGDKLTPNQTRNLKIVYDKTIRKGVASDINQIYPFVENNEEMNKTDKANIIKILRSIAHYGAFNPEHVVDPIKDVIEGKIPILNIRGFEDFGVARGSIIAAFISIWLRNVTNGWKKAKKKKKGSMNIAIDELPRWCPKNGEPSCKKVILEGAELNRAEGINYVLSAQDPASIPKRLVDQCRYIFIPRGANKAMIKLVFSDLTGIVSSHPSHIHRIMKKKRDMPPYSWFAINTDASSYEIIQPYFCLSWHQETRG
ncbi:helicase HerA domain-containing protein [Candidatus Poribacteria bacterium]